MLKLIMVLTLIAAANFVYADNHSAVPIVFYNYTVTGDAFVGASYGPTVNDDGGTAQTVMQLSGVQPVGIFINGVPELCYIVGGQLVLNMALYKGDTISIIYGQAQVSPPGITCGCYGSACTAG